MSNYIFPIESRKWSDFLRMMEQVDEPALSTIKALEDHVLDPESKQKLLHAEALLDELLKNIRAEVISHGFRKAS